MRLDVSRMTGGYALRLRFAVRARGPVHALPRGGAAGRCDVDAARGGPADAAATTSSTSPYVSGDELDLRAWARDALALALPTQIVCREDCRGLCPVCGENLNQAGPDHAPRPEPEPLGELRELKFEKHPAPDLDSDPDSRPPLDWPTHGRPQAKAVALAHQQAALAAQDRRAAPRHVPALPRAAPPAPRVPELRHLRRAARSSRRRPDAERALASERVIALDANGADRGPATVAEGGRALRRAASRSSARPPSSAGLRATWWTPRSRSRNDEEPVRAVRSKPDASIVQAARAVAAGRGRRARVGRLDRRRAGRRRAPPEAHAGRAPPGVAVLLPMPGAPVLMLDVGRQRRGAPRAPRAVRLHGLRLHGGACTASRARAWGCCRSARSRRRARPTWWPRTSGWPRPAAAQLRRATSRASTSPPGGADVIVTDGFTGNVALKLMEGTAQTVRGRGPRRGSLEPGVDARRPADPRRRSAACASELDPNTMGGAILLGVRGIVVVAHGGSSAEGIANAVRAGAARGGRADGRAHRGGPRGRRAPCGPHPLLRVAALR